MSQFSGLKLFSLLCLASVGTVLYYLPTLEGREPEASSHEASAASGSTSTKSKSDKSESKMGLVSETAYEDLQKAKQELAQKQKELSARESELKIREKALGDELKKIEFARESIEKIQESRKKEHDQKVAKLVEATLTMNPKAAAKLLATVNDELAVAVMTLVETPRLAKILNVMDPIRASALSELMTGVGKTKVSTEKGGERHDHKNERYADDRSPQPAS